VHESQKVQGAKIPPVDLKDFAIEPLSTLEFAPLMESERILEKRIPHAEPTAKCAGAPPLCCICHIRT
jgi:hypothetical protein